MARLNRRGTQRRQHAADALAELDPMLRWDLEDGCSLERFATLEDMAHVWERVGDELLVEWIAERPGSRPFAWWVCEHRQERPVTGSWATPAVVARHRAESRFGFLHSDVWSGREALQETEWSYLHRAGLLTEDELKRLAVFDAILPIYKQMGRSFRLDF